MSHPSADETLRVVVVDDDFHVAHAHALSVARVPGFTVIGESHTLREAVAAIQTDTPDLVLLDMYLPDGSGLDLMRSLAAVAVEPPDVIAVTAARDIDTVRAALQLGAFYYLVKPFPVRALHEQLRAYRDWSRRLTNASHADQPLVDELFTRRASGSRKPSTAALPPTMAKVMNIVSSSSQPIGATDVAAQLGASRPTAQRYLAALLRRQLIDLDLSYGTTGRPEHRYQARGSG